MTTKVRGTLDREVRMDTTSWGDSRRMRSISVAMALMLHSLTLQLVPIRRWPPRFQRRFADEIR